MPRPIEALLHPDALARNLAVARRLAGDARLWAVIKANAYGHGIERVWPGLLGADGLAMLDLDEAQRVRNLGWRGPVLLLEGCFEPRDLELCSRLNLWHVVHHEMQIDWLAAHKTHQPHRVFLKMNSGMNRLGFTGDHLRSAWTRLNALPQVDEAQRVRNLGWRGPVLLLEGCFEPRDLELCSRLNLWHVVHHESQIDWLAAHKTHQPHRVFLKMNSGMNRLGFTGDHLRSAWTRLNALPQVDEISLVTHFSDADGPRGIAHQVAAFHAATHDLPGERSLSNSAAILRHADAADVRADWVRSGILSYGSAPDFPEHDIAHWGLTPTMTLRSRLISTQSLQPGDTVGYGSRFRAEHPMRIGIVACGYADGYPRHAPTGTPVLVDGVRTTTVGRVSMDMLAVDLTPVPLAEVGSEVTLWGHGPSGTVLPIDEVAHTAGTIGYELMCALALRVPVKVVEAVTSGSV